MNGHFQRFSANEKCGSDHRGALLSVNPQGGTLRRVFGLRLYVFAKHPLSLPVSQLTV